MMTYPRCLLFCISPVTLRPALARVRWAAACGLLAFLWTLPISAQTGGGVDHFTWDSLPASPRVGAAFPVRLTARDTAERVVSNYSGNVRLSAAAGVTTTNLFADGFEDGDYAGWDLNATTGNWSVATNTAGSGQNSLTLVGGRRGHRDGLWHALPNLQPDVVRFQVRTLRTDAIGGFVTMGTGTNLDDIAVYFNMTLDGMGVVEDVHGGHRVPYQAGRWYQIELRFSWADRTIDFSVDGVLQRRGIPFRRPSVASLTRIDLYNYDHTQSWWDGIEFVQDNLPVRVPVSPGLAGPWVNGRWDGNMTLSAAAHGVALQAADEAGHGGASALFDVVADNQLLVWQTRLPEPAALGAPITNTVRVLNPGPLSASGVYLTNRLPAGVTANSVQISSGACTTAAGQIVCGPLTVPAGTQLTMSAAMSPTNYARLTNRVAVLQPTGTPGSNRVYTSEAVFAATPPVLTVRDVWVAEGDSGRTDAIFDLTLSASQPLPVTVQFVTSNLTATVFSDYTPADGVVVIPPGATHQSVIVPVVGETVREADEAFVLYLRQAENAILNATPAYGFIVDDDLGSPAPVPFFEDWEGGLRRFWVRSGAGNFGATLVRSNEPFAGAFHLVMDNPLNDGLLVRSEMTLALDLAGAVNPVLRFRARGSYDDPPEGPPPVPFVGTADFDGVAVSSDGVHWYEALGLRSLTTQYAEFSVPLDEVVRRYGLTYSAKFQIRFTRVCAYAFPTSGMALDDISVTTDPMPLLAGPVQLLSEACAPANGVIDPGETVTATFWLTNSGSQSYGPLTATLLSDDRVTAVGPTQTQVFAGLGPGAAGGRPFTFIASGLCGQAATAWLELKDAGVLVGRVPFEIILGRSYTNYYSFPEVGPLVIPSVGVADSYPSTYEVAGTVGQVGRVVVTLHDLHHSAPDHLDILLRGPGGQIVTLMSDAGGSFPVDGVTLTFDSAATNLLPEDGQIVSGTYAAANYGGADTYPPPLPGPPNTTSLEEFLGTTANGDWELYIVDDTEGEEGVLGGWTLQVDGRVVSCCDGAPPADLSLAMAAPLTASLDGLQRVVSTVRNLGPAPAEAVVFSNALPRGAVFVAASSSAGACTWDGAFIRCPLGTLATNATAQINVDLRPGVTGPITNVAVVVTSTRDSDLTNNVASAVSSVLAPQLATVAVSGTESSNGTTFTRFDLTVSPMTRTAMVYFATAGLGAVAGADFAPTNGVLVFRPGETNKSISVRILDDLMDEPSEDFYLTLYNPLNITLGGSRVTGFVIDNDPPPVVSVQNVSVFEGNAGLTAAEFRVHLSAPSAQLILVNYATADGTAAAGLDYKPASDVITLVPGETNRVIPVWVRGDRLNETDESFAFNLSAPVNSTLGNAQAIGTIFNDDLLPSFAIEATRLLAESCRPTNGVVDPGERVSVRFTVRNVSTGPARGTNVTAALLETGGVLAPTPARLLGALAPGASQTADFSFTAAASCGESLNVTFALRDSTTDLDPVVVSIPVGRLVTSFAETFDDVTAPAVPGPWTVDHSGAGEAWKTAASGAAGLNAITAQNPSERSTNDLVSPPLLIHSEQAWLSFLHNFNTESNWDGGTLAISIDDGPFVDIEEAGGTFELGEYTGLVEDLWLGWTGDSGGFVPVRIALPSDLAGHPFRLRWQFTSDDNTGGVGWTIDSIVLNDGYDCCDNSPPLLTSMLRTGEQITLQWTSLPGRQYQVQFKAALNDPSWSNLGGVLTADSSLMIATDQAPASVGRYYRIVLLP